MRIINLLSFITLILNATCSTLSLSKSIPQRFSYGSNIISYFTSRVVKNDESIKLLSQQLKIPGPWNAPRVIWNFVWKLQNFILPILHYFDRCAPADTCFNLPVLWWKAIAGNDRYSITYDNNTAYDLLPPFTRWLVKYPLCLLYPKLHHQNIAMRTAYLDSMIHDIINNKINITHSNNIIQSTTNEMITSQSSKDIQSLSSSSHSIHHQSHLPSTTYTENDTTSNIHYHIINLGAGFDTRSLRFVTQYNHVTFYELDLLQVIKQKICMFQRFIHRRIWMQDKLPFLYDTDLNNISMTVSQINNILSTHIFPISKNGDINNNNNTSSSVTEYNNNNSNVNKVSISSSIQDNKSRKTVDNRIVFMTEASLFYLNQSIVTSLIQQCIQTAKQYTYTPNIIFCFVDRLPLPSSKRPSSSSTTNTTTNTTNTISASSATTGSSSSSSVSVTNGDSVTKSSNSVETTTTDNNSSGNNNSKKKKARSLWQRPVQHIEINIEKEHQEALEFFQNLNMTLIQWQIKPGIARHMGMATI